MLLRYGDATLWCWISHNWQEWRFAVCYGPAWLTIIASFLIYIAAGVRIYRSQRTLRALGRVGRQSGGRGPNSLGHTRVTSDVQTANAASFSTHTYLPGNPGHASYSVTVGHGRRPSRSGRMRRRRNPPVEVSQAAWQYMRGCMCFFFAMLVTCTCALCFGSHALLHGTDSGLALNPTSFDPSPRYFNSISTTKVKL